MYLVYSLLLGLGFLIMLPKFMLDAWRHGKYISGLKERLGFLTQESANARLVIWLHCVSVGEVQAARPLFAALRRELPEYAIAVSTVTVTGQQLAQEVFKGEAARVFYFPVDWRWTVKRTLDIINPSLVLLMETELWPNFLRECKDRRIASAVVNGRLSAKSFSRYKLIRQFISRVVNCLDLAVMQTDADAERILRLGLSGDRVSVCGNMKFDAETTAFINPSTADFAKHFGISTAPVLLAASTHEPEEKIILEVFRRLRGGKSRDVRLIIAPRHPERFNSVAALLEASEYSWSRRSNANHNGNVGADIILLDSIGELKSLFPVASVVFVGGSLAPIGGHNILEPAAAGACIVTGPHTWNFEAIIKAFNAENAIVQIETTDDAEARLVEVIGELLAAPQQRQALVERAQRLIAENRGATSRTMTLLKTLLPMQTNP